MSNYENKEYKSDENTPVLKSELYSEISKIRLELVRQEHRLIPALKNLYVSIKNDSGDKASRQQTLASLYSIASILWRRRTLPVIIASVGGVVGTIIAIATLLEFQKQNSLFITQNQEVIEQSNLLREQNSQQLVSTNGQMVSSLIGDLFNTKIVIGVNEDSVWVLPRPLILRIYSVSNALTPYSIVNSSEVVQSSAYGPTLKYSKERASLLLALQSLKIKFPLYPAPNFEYSDLTGANFNGDFEVANGSYVNFSKLSYFNDRVNLSGAKLRGSLLIEAQLSTAILSGADLRESNLTSANLTYAYIHSVQFSNAILKGTEFHGAELINVDFRGAKFLTLEQLKETKSIIGVTLDSSRGDWIDSLKLYNKII